MLREEDLIFFALGRRSCYDGNKNMDFAKVSFVFVKNSIEFNLLCGIIQSVFLCIAIEEYACQK